MTTLKKRIHVITPIVTQGFRNCDDFAMFESADLTVTCDLLDAGPSSIESEFDEAMAVPDMLRKAVKAEREGADAIVIDCLGDPGVKAARELLQIPVIGPGEAAMHMVAMLGHKFSVVTVLDSVCPMIANNARLCGLDSKLASIRVVQVSVLDLEKDKESLYRNLAAESIAAVREDKAHAIVLGCTGMMGCADVIMQVLTQEFGTFIPVVDPVPAAMVTAMGMLKLGLFHSKLTYAVPPKKPMIGYDMLHQSAAAE